MTSRKNTADENYLRGKISLWQKRADDHKEKQLINPFSEWGGASHRAALDKNDPNYGHPVEGSLTDLRGRQAAKHLNAEVVELCYVITSIGKEQPDGSYTICFKSLFQAYTRISDKLVGMLMTARKRGLVKFEGEMLYQRRDDNVIITYIPQAPEIPQDPETQ